MLTSIKRYIHQIVRTLTEITHSGESNIGFLNKSTSRILIIALRGFKEDNCRWNSAALTYYSLLSLFPVFAVAFGIAKGFGLDDRLERGLKVALSEHPLLAEKVIQITYNYIDQAKGGLIAGIGVLFLLFTTILLLKRIEEALNKIWKIRQGRSFGRMLTDYLTVVIFCPIFLIISASLSIYVATSIQEVIQIPYISEIIDQVISITIHLLPIVVSWFLFALLFFFIPHTKVNFAHALSAGVITGTLYQIIQWLYIFFQVNISNLGAVYGSFAALPLFFIWLNVSWMVTLLGAEFAYHASVDKEEKTVREGKSSDSQSMPLKQVAVLIAFKSIKRFTQHSPPIQPSEFAAEIGISVNTTTNLFERLVSSGLLVEVVGDKGQKGFSPAYSPRNIRIRDVINAIDEDKNHMINVNLTDELKKIDDVIRALDKQATDSKYNAILRDMI